MSAVLQLVTKVFQQPPIPFEPSRQSLKLWATYCLRDRGFKVVYASQADFAIESKGEKIYFKLCTIPPAQEELDPSVNWLIWNLETQLIQVQGATA